MYSLAFFALFLIDTCPLFVECDDATLQTFTLTAVNATTMRLDSVDSSPSSSYVFTVVGNRTTANCTFTGVNPTKNNWLVSSNCAGVTNEGSFYINSSAFDFEFDDPSQLTGPWTVRAMQRNRTVRGLEEDDPSYEPLPPKALERRWDFGLGRFVIDEHPIIDDDNMAISYTTNSPDKKRRKKRNVLSDNQLELGVNVDQCLWDQFLATYGPDVGTARKALDNYVDAVVATANLMWNLDSIQPNLAIRVVKYLVWTTQPEEAPATYYDDIENYLQSTCLLAKPNASGFDHSIVLSGCNLTRNGEPIEGLAYSDQVCTASSCSVVSGGVGNGLSAGYTLAHEIGHAINMKHDGDTNYAETSYCDPNCCMMSPYGASSTSAEWSVCSKMRYHEKLVDMMVDDSNCLESLGAGQSPGELPGQSDPDEGQCMDQLGSCGRQYIGDVSDCTKLYCTNTNGETSIVFNITRLDGSYCGPNKICETGVCVESPIPLPVVDGGWSAWNSNPEEVCGGGNCSICTVDDQVSARVEVRSCNNPYPLNGGAPCPGLNVRGIFCANCTNTGSQIDVGSYENNTCSSKYPGSIPAAGTECTFVCSINGVFQGRLWLPTGSSCSDNGRCINGQCLHALCADLNIYVGAVSECPTDSVVDCQYSSWSSWSECSATCDTGNQTRTRTITQEALNGGAPCDQPLEDVLSCNSTACQCTLTSWTQWTTCSVTCGTGMQTRDRSIEVPGSSCSSDLHGTQVCEGVACPIGCVYSMWSAWSDCSVTCGTGTQTKTRTVVMENANGGSACDESSLNATQSCTLDTCPSLSNCSFQLTANNVYGGNLGSTPRLITNIDRATCEELCSSEGVSPTSPCYAYLYSQNFCNLYNQIDGMIQQANLSTNQLYENIEKGDAPLNRTLCNFYATQANFVVGSGDSTVNGGVVTGSDMCQLQCLGRLGTGCVALAFNSQTRTCIFYRAVPNVLTTDPSSTNIFYQPICSTELVEQDDGECSITPTVPQGSSTTIPPSTSSPPGSEIAPNGCPYVNTWSNVWQEAPFSSDWTTVGPQASCASSCNRWTEFSCQGYLSAGAGMDCILFGAVTGQVALYNQSLYDMYEPVCEGDSTEHDVCYFGMTANHVNKTAAGSGKFGGYFKFQSSCAELCLLNYGIPPCAAFTYEWDNGECTVYADIPTALIDLNSTSDLYAKQCEAQQFPFG